MTAARTLFALVVLLPLLETGALDIIYHLTDEQYYSMPQLFHLDEYDGCLATGDVYCLGSFELSADPDNQLFQTLQGYSANWVDNFNHTRLHRGLCLNRSCTAHVTQAARSAHATLRTPLHDSRLWFSSCVNATVSQRFGLRARLYQLEYCTRGVDAEGRGPLTVNEKAFAAVVAALIGLAILSTALDMTLSDHAKKDAGWALSWSVRQSWRSLSAPLGRPRASQPSAPDCDLRVFDGLRVLCMMTVIVEHISWLGTLSYVGDTRYFETIRRSFDVMLMTNSSMVVQIFFVMSSFLLAHKLLQERSDLPPIRTFLTTMMNRIIRITPSYIVVVWFAASWWERLGHGPQWTPLVRSEAAICRHKWWTHLLFLNNIIYPDEKCLIQTWYLAADTQLYAVVLALTLLLRRCRGALVTVILLLITVTAATLGLAYAWQLLPTFLVHRPEAVRDLYREEAAFNVLYQSSLGNATGALVGLLLALVHRALQARGLRIQHMQMVSWISMMATPMAVWWASSSPLMLGAGPPTRVGAAVLAAIERPVFALLVATALLGVMNGVRSPWGTWLSGAWWSLFARLTFGALLLHMPINKALLAMRHAPMQLDRINVIVEWFGVAALSYAAAVPLTFLVELPIMRLHKELTRTSTNRLHDKQPQNSPPKAIKSDT